MSHRSALVAGVLAGLIAIAPSSPASAQSGPTLRVAYYPAELRTDAGAQAVYRRIRHDARRVCLHSAVNSYYWTTRACSRELVDLAVRKLASPRVAGIDAATGSTRIASAR